MLAFYAFWKHEKNSCFLIFSVYRKKALSDWFEMDYDENLG